MTFGILGIIATAIATVVALYDGREAEKTENEYKFGLPKLKFYLLCCAVIIALVTGINTWKDEVEKNEAVKKADDLARNLEEAKSEVIISKNKIAELQNILLIESKRSNLGLYITSKNAKNWNPQDQNSITIGEGGNIVSIIIRDTKKEQNKTKTTSNENFNYIINELIELDDAKHLMSLVLNAGNISDIKEIKKLVNLEYLEMKAMEITDDDLQYLSGLIKIRELNLDYCNINGSGLAHLKACKNLRKIVLGHNPVLDIKEAIKHLRMIESLEELDFYDCNFRITKDDKEVIESFKSLPYLKRVNFNTNLKNDKIVPPQLGEELQKHFDNNPIKQQ